MDSGLGGQHLKSRDTVVDIEAWNLVFASGFSFSLCQREAMGGFYVCVEMCTFGGIRMCKGGKLLTNLAIYCHGIWWPLLSFGLLLISLHLSLFLSLSCPLLISLSSTGGSNMATFFLCTLVEKTIFNCTYFFPHTSTLGI